MAITENGTEAEDLQYDPSRRRLIGGAALGAATLAVTSVSPGVVGIAGAQELSNADAPYIPRRRGEGLLGDIPGLRPARSAFFTEFPSYDRAYTRVPVNPFGGYDFAMGYMAEGVQGADPDSPNFPNGQFSNTSGLFETVTLKEGGATPPIAADTGDCLLYTSPSPRDRG